MTRTAFQFPPLRAAAALALAAVMLAGCGSSDSNDQAAAAEPSAAASQAAASEAAVPDNLAVAGPDGVTSAKSSPAPRTDSDADAETTDENGNPVSAGPPQPTEEDVRRALEEAANK